MSTEELVAEPTSYTQQCMVKGSFMRAIYVMSLERRTWEWRRLWRRAKDYDLFRMLALLRRCWYRWQALASSKNPHRTEILLLLAQREAMLRDSIALRSLLAQSLSRRPQ